MARRATPNPLRRRWREHLGGTLIALSILLLTMAVVVGPATTIGHRLSERIEAWVAYIAPVDDENLELAIADPPHATSAAQVGSAVVTAQPLSQEVEFDH